MKEELLRKRDKLIPRGVYNTNPVFIETAEGAVVWGKDGKRYIDFAGAIGSLNVGHANPEVKEAVKTQAEKFLGSCFHTAMHEPYLQVVEKLVSLFPGDFPKKGFLVNSGAEAVENAVKIARHYTSRPGVVVFEHAFHGRTLLTLAMTSKVVPYKKGFGPFPSEIYRLPYPYCYRCPFSSKYPDCNIKCAFYIEEFFITHVDPEEVAAVVIEPVIGEGGFIVPPREYVVKLREITEKYGILLVADEVQSGFCRTGKFFAIENFGVVPDIITIAKSIAGGLPLAAVVGRAEIMDHPQVGGLGGTFGGNPVSCAAAVAAIEFALRENLCEKARLLGEKVLSRFRGWKERFPFVGDVRGLGAMVAFEVVRPGTKEPWKEATSRIVEEAYRRGLLLISAGVFSNVIRVLMPLVIGDGELEEGLSILERAMEEV